jgi:hypothetical protein
MQLSSLPGTQPVIPDSFLGGSAPRLRCFFLDIPFPGLPNLLLSATYLVKFWYINIPPSGYISPEAIVAVLSTLSSLEKLYLDIESSQSRSSGRPDVRLHQNALSSLLSNVLNSRALPDIQRTS